MSTDIILFDENKSNEKITIAQLGETYRERSMNTKKNRTHPIDHIEFVQTIIKSLDESKSMHIAHPMTVTKNDITKMERHGESRPWTLPNVRINKMVGKIDLLPDNEEFRPAIGYSFNPSGLSLVYGMNVMVCDNMSIFGDTLLNTYGKDHMSIKTIFLHLQHWLRNTVDIYASQMEIVNAMQQTGITMDSLYKTIGWFTTRTFKANDGDPFNQTELKQFITSLIEVGKEKKADMNLWDLYNAGTEIMKPGRINRTERVFAINSGFSMALMMLFPNLKEPFQAYKEIVEPIVIEND